MPEPRGLGRRLEPRANMRRELTPVQADLQRIKKLALITGLYVGATENLKLNEYIPLREEALSAKVEDLPVDIMAQQREANRRIIASNLAAKPEQVVTAVNNSQYSVTIPAISEAEAVTVSEQATQQFMERLHQQSSHLNIEVTPDFERPLKRMHLRLDTFTERMMSKMRDQLEALKATLPSDVVIVIDPKVATWAQPMIESYGLQVEVLDQREGNIGQWAQDVGEFVSFQNSNGERTLGLLYSGYPEHILELAEEKPNGYARIKAVAQFDGGDVSATDRHFLIGQSAAVTTTTDLAFHHEIRVDANTLTTVFSEIMHKPTLVLGPDQLPAPLFHLDMAVMPIDTNTVAVLDYDWHPDDLKWIEAEIGQNQLGAQAIRDARYSAYTLDVIQQQLQAAGYKVVTVPTSVDHILRTESFVNGIPYTKDGQRHYMMPTFNGDASQAAAALTKAGLIVDQVPNTTAIYRGNLHCLFNVEPAIH